jgi:hypothetical protein
MIVYARSEVFVVAFQNTAQTLLYIISPFITSTLSAFGVMKDLDQSLLKEDMYFLPGQCPSIKVVFFPFLVSLHFLTPHFSTLFTSS